MAALAAAALFSLPALAQVKVGVVSSSTGPTALVFEGRLSADFLGAVA